MNLPMNGDSFMLKIIFLNEDTILLVRVKNS